MGEAHEEIRSLGGDVVAVLQYGAEEVDEFCRDRDVPFRCLGDPDREAYAAVGLRRGSLREWMGPQMLTAFVRAAKKKALVGDPKGGDVALRPGTFVVGRDGRVAYAHYNADSADNAPGEAVLAALRAAARESVRP